MDNSFRQILEQAKALQEAMKKAKGEVKTIKVVGAAGASMVKVVMDGRYHVQQIEIDDEIYKEGKAVVIDLLLAAFNDATAKVEKAVKEKMSNFSTGFGLPPNFQMPFMDGDENQ
jgi:hypothetical protein